ncbi:MAG: GFA family protein [Pseudomonadota bacterium]
MSGEPLFRILCHCSICQRFNNANHADVVVYRAASVVRPAPGIVSFTTYKPPPNVKRGICTGCGQAAIEIFDAPLLPKLTIVPFAIHAESAQLPAPRGHIFYEKRREDAGDALPKHEGFLRSQLAFGKALLGSGRSAATAN